MKKNLHPKWFSKTFVYYDNSLIKIVSSTKHQIYVDSWSGTHPFFNKSQISTTTRSQIDRFLQKYKY
uniref:Large ribosomal subunit protein bL31c n=1 Tax=Pteridomonas danica TaxID=38822 RepID=A0A7T1FUH5_9STRA|nr:ribosomal protein L31 [Pteridomonas danica]QPM99303.1 ribosomal protein L31 [Pteridomonas danica]